MPETIIDQTSILGVILRGLCLGAALGLIIAFGRHGEQLDLGLAVVYAMFASTVGVMLGLLAEILKTNR